MDTVERGRDPEAEELRQFLALGRNEIPDALHLLREARATRPPARALAPVVEVHLLSVLRWARAHDTYLTAAQLTVLLGRTAWTVRTHLNKLLVRKKAVTQYAGRKAPGQGYRAADNV